MVRPRRIDGRSRANIVAAGPAAEVIFTAIEAGDAYDAPEAGDIAAVALMLGEPHPELVRDHAWTPFQPLEQSIETAVDLLVEHWHDVEAIAPALLGATAALTYRDCLRLVCADLQPPDRKG